MNESSGDNIDRLVAAGLVDAGAELPDAHARFLNEDLTEDEVECLISILQKVEDANIPILKHPYYACIPIW